MKAHIIRCDGSEERTDVEHGGVAAAIGATTTDSVNLRDGRIMFVDDDGWEFVVKHVSPTHIVHVPTRARRPVNTKATALYHSVCVPGTTHQIVGDVCIVAESESP